MELHRKFECYVYLERGKVSWQNVYWIILQNKMAEFIKVELETFIDEIRKYPVRKKTETPSEGDTDLFIY